MPRYAAFLRGVMPALVTMAQLKAAFEAAGFKDVKTVIGSGNVLFDARAASDESLARKADAAMEREIGGTFPAIVRSVEELRELLAADPFARFTIPRDAKRVVTFLREPPKVLPKLPVELEGARILAVEGRHVFTRTSASRARPSS
jgi:uncharacterized protein (DUF1697 family)